MWAGDSLVKRIIFGLGALIGGLSLAATASQAQSWDPRAGYSSQRGCGECGYQPPPPPPSDCYDRCGNPRGSDYPRDPRGYGPPQGPGGYMGYYDQYQPGQSAWRPGLLLPPYFRGYRVSDPRLARARRGNAWYRVGNEFILADTATGEVKSIVTFP